MASTTPAKSLEETQLKSFWSYINRKKITKGSIILYYFLKKQILEFKSNLFIVQNAGSREKYKEETSHHF